MNGSHVLRLCSGGGEKRMGRCSWRAPLILTEVEGSGPGNGLAAIEEAQ
jgi:hypothetical protein